VSVSIATRGLYCLLRDIVSTSAIIEVELSANPIIEAELPLNPILETELEANPVIETDLVSNPIIEATIDGGTAMELCFDRNETRVVTFKIFDFTDPCDPTTRTARDLSVNPDVVLLTVRDSADVQQFQLTLANSNQTTNTGETVATFTQTETDIADDTYFFDLVATFGASQFVAIRRSRFIIGKSVHTP